MTALLFTVRTAFRNFAFVLMLLTPVLAFSEDLLQRPGWKWRIWPVRPEAVSTADPANALGERKLNDQFKPIAGAELRFDAREWFRTLGVNVPDGGYAILEREELTLVLFAPNEVVAAAVKILGRRKEVETPNIEIEISLAECRIARDASLDGLSYPDLRKASGVTWEEREHLIMRTLGGQRVAGERVLRKPSIKVPSLPPKSRVLVPMGAGDRGFQVELEPFAEPGGLTGIDFDLIFEHRGPLGAGGPAFEATLLTKLTAWQDYPTVVATWTVASSKSRTELTRYIALILRSRVVDSDALREATQMNPPLTK